jgi:tRNA G10  N-methylase Trm11
VAEFQAELIQGDTVIIPFAGTGMDALFLLRRNKDVIMSDSSAEHLALAVTNVQQHIPSIAGHLITQAIDAFAALPLFSGLFDAAILDPPWNVSHYRASKVVSLDEMTPIMLEKLIEQTLRGCSECLVKCPHSLRVDDLRRFGKPLACYNIQFEGHPLLILAHFGARDDERTIDMM